MFKSVESIDRTEWELIDLDTGKTISKVQWADDETGEYEVLKVDNNGVIVYDQITNKPMKEHKKGNIKLVRKQ